MGYVLWFYHSHSHFNNGFSQIFRKLPTDPKNNVSDLASLPLICSLKASLRMVQTKSATWKILEKIGNVFIIRTC